MATADSALAKNDLQGRWADLGMGSAKTTATQVALRRRVHWKGTDGGTAGSAIGEEICFRAEVACTVISAHFCGGIAITADASNIATFLLQKRPASGPSSPVTVASASTVTTDPVFGSNYTAWTPLQLTNSGTAANLSMVAGDVLTMKVTKGGTGVAVGAAATATGANIHIAIVVEEAY